MSGWHGGATIAGKAGYAIVCAVAALIVVVSGFAYFVKAQIGDIGGSDVLSGGPQTGAMNILLMGLESRTDYDGNILSPQLLTAMHAGSVQGVENGVGGQDTNTLILIHIFAGGKKAVGFSIPRDDWVTYPATYDGQTQGKIDQEYGFAWAQSLSQTLNSGMSQDQRYLQANEAGQSATIDTVESLTGVTINHFAEVNLAGFFYLAQAFGGIEVCLKSWNGGENLHDANSGFNQSTPGYHLLAADQALAFVRERDNLPNGDIDRTHRQQAVLDYVVWKLEHEGIFNSITQLTDLLNIAKTYIRTDNGWNLLDFASEMRALSGKNLTFITAPVISTDGSIDGQTVNLISTTAVKNAVQNAFYPPSPSPASSAKASSTGSSSLSPAKTTVDVYNGGAPAGMAGQVSQALTSAGFKAGTVADTSAQSSTQVLYGTGGDQSAATIAGYFSGVTATASSSVAAGHVEVLLAPDVTSVPQSMTAAAQSGGASASPSSSGSASASPSSSAGNNGQSGSAVTVQANAKYGIPCVY